MSHTVSDVARMSGVTVRTLHHYHKLGLVTPSHRTESGYRIYERADLERLQEVLLLRELDIPLSVIAGVVDGDKSGRATVLKEQRVALLKRRERLDRIIATVDASLSSLKGSNMTDTQLFDGFDPSEYQEEAEERWGETESYQEAQRRTDSYTPEDWKAVRAESETIEAGLAELLVAGVSVDDERAITLAEAHRMHIDKWYYPCSTEMHAALADSYVSDPRFTKHYEKRQTGLAEYVRDAIYANGLS